MNDIVDMREKFLEVFAGRTEEHAIREAINAAVATRRGGKFYETTDVRKRTALREDWTKLIRAESTRYVRGDKVTDDEHCESISRIAATLSSEFKECLSNGRLGYGPSQKAFNLYLKGLWCLGRIAMPPHCPVDRIVLGKAKVDGAWTRCTRDEYMGWILKLRQEAERQGLSLSEWENKVWLEEKLKRKKEDPGSQCGR
ncbi:MAG: hypothetical protein ACLPVW_07705 [Terriglobales bacterium]